MATPQAQLDYNGNSGVFSDAGVTPAVNNATVQQWTHGGTLGANNATQATAGVRPIFKTAGPNGNPYLWFQKAQALDLGTARTTDTAFTWMAVVRMFNDGTIVGGDRWSPNFGGLPKPSIRNNATDITATANYSGPTPVSWLCLAFKRSGTTGSHWVNGVKLGANITMATTSPNVGTIGARNAGGYVNFGDMHLARLQYWTSALSDADMLDWANAHIATYGLITAATYVDVTSTHASLLSSGAVTNGTIATDSATHNTESFQTSQKEIKFKGAEVWAQYQDTNNANASFGVDAADGTWTTHNIANNGVNLGISYKLMASGLTDDGVTEHTFKWRGSGSANVALDRDVAFRFVSYAATASIAAVARKGTQYYPRTSGIAGNTGVIFENPDAWQTVDITGQQAYQRKSALSWQGNAIRFRATTAYVSVFAQSHGETWALIVDNGAPIIKTTTNASFADVVTWSGLDSTAEHEYVIIPHLTAGGFEHQPIMLMVGQKADTTAGVLNTAALTQREAIMIFGDSLAGPSCDAGVGNYWGAGVTLRKGKQLIGRAVGGTQASQFSAGNPSYNNTGVDWAVAHKAKATTEIASVTPTKIYISLAYNDFQHGVSQAQFLTGMGVIFTYLRTAWPLAVIYLLDIDADLTVAGLNSFRTYQAAAVTAANDPNIRLLPALTATTGYTNANGAHSCDGIHPTLVGHTLYEGQIELKESAFDVSGSSAARRNFIGIGIRI